MESNLIVLLRNLGVLWLTIEFLWTGFYFYSLSRTDIFRRKAFLFTMIGIMFLTIFVIGLLVILHFPPEIIEIVRGWSIIIVIPLIISIRRYRKIFTNADEFINQVTPPSSQPK